MATEDDPDGGRAAPAATGRTLHEAHPPPLASRPPRGSRTRAATTTCSTRLAADPAFAAVRRALAALCDPRRFVGRAPQQVEEFLEAEVEPLILQHQAAIAAQRDEVKV